MKVTLDVPDSIDYQLVYRMERDRAYQPALGPSFTFTMLDSVAAALRCREPLLQALGSKGTLTAAAKLATGIRRFYLVRHEGKAVSYGWGTVGQCRHYKVERDSVVIGPIWTDPNLRGKGLATLALQAAIDDYIRRGQKIFYIDTSKLNTAAQRVFQKSGFGEPVALYFR
jgi:ribosomal protein S18 acetylase RimI-like enzyme